MARQTSIKRFNISSEKIVGESGGVSTSDIVSGKKMCGVKFIVNTTRMKYLMQVMLHCFIT